MGLRAGSWCWILGVAILAAGAEARAAGDIVAGPMVGHVTEKSARVWMQLSVSKEVTMTCVEERGGPVSEVGVDVEGPLPFTCDIPLTNLKPNKNYRIEVKLDDEAVNAGAGVLIRTAPPAGEEASFGLAFGGGLEAKGKGTQPLFKAANALDPRAFFFLGNTLTLPAKLEEFPRTHRAAVRFIADAYSKERREPDLQQLFRSTACYAVWDDRDFGVPESNKDWVYKEEAWTAFQHFWPNPDWGTPDNPGCYFTLTLGDVDIFMLDGRMYRDADSDPARKTMLGGKQLEWLKKGLKESRATFKVIGCGSQMLADYGQGDTWAAYQPEQGDFLKWVFANRISGVIFVSGGKHGGEITGRKPGPGEGGYPLFEVTSSSRGKELAGNANRQGAVVEGNQFGTLDFGGVREHRFVTMRVRDDEGKAKLEQTAFAVQLR